MILYKRVAESIFIATLTDLHPAQPTRSALITAAVREVVLVPVRRLLDCIVRRSAPLRYYPGH